MKASKFVPFMLRRGDGSTLSLDFTAMSSLDSRFTYTRNSIATFINSSGLVQQVTAAATNDPTKARFDYNPSTLAPRGLLIEGSATNLLNFSESFAASGGTNNNWTDSNITRATGNTDPAGGTTAVRFTASAGNATVISSAAIGTTTTRTFSIFLRRVTGTGNIDYTLDNGSTYTTQAITGSWVRYTFAATSANHQVGIRIVTSGDAIEMWGAQLETGSGASSYIPSGASQGQRAADSCAMTGTNFSSWFAGVTTGYSVLWSCSPQSRQAGAFPPMICLRGPSDSGSRSYYYNDGTYNTAHRTSNGTTVTESFGPNSLTYGVARKFAISVTNGSQLVSSNGATANSNTQAITSFNQTTLGFGNDADTTPGNLTGRQHFQSFKFWPYPQTQAALNALTA